MDDGLLRYDDASSRRGVILERLRDAGFLSIADLSRDLRVSDMTVRRDLRRLSDEGKVRVVRGGVSLPPGEHRAAGFSRRAGTQAEAKRRIGRAAAGLVRDADSIAVDAGTTAFEVADALPDGFAGSVITHSVPVLQHLLERGGTRVVGLGGDLNPDSRAFVGPMTVDGAANVRVRLFFLGAAAVDGRGVYVSTDLERPTKRALMQVADKVVLLVDGSKFHASAAVLLCPLTDVDVLVTDVAPAPELDEPLAAAGVEVLLAADVPEGRGEAAAEE